MRMQPQFSQFFVTKNTIALQEYKVSGSASRCQTEKNCSEKEKFCSDQLVEVLFQAELWYSLLLQIKCFYLLKYQYFGGVFIAKAMFLELCSHIYFFPSR